MPRNSPGTFGILTSVLGVALLLFTFVEAYLLLHGESSVNLTDITSSMDNLLFAAVEALFLGIMGWVGSILVLRGLEYLKVEKGIGVVTFKIDKGVGIVTQQAEEKEENPQPVAPSSDSNGS